MYSKIILCNRCNSTVLFIDVTVGYFAYCRQCDEDLYTFECREEII